MAGSIWEFFGYRSSDASTLARLHAEEQKCPFLDAQCSKRLSDGTVSGACTIKPVKTGPVIACPIRLYAQNYDILRDVAVRAFDEDIVLAPGRKAVTEARRTSSERVAVFGKGWGGELRLPQRGGKGAYFVDWVLARIDASGQLTEFVAVEVQTIDTTGSYRQARAALLAPDRRTVKDTVGLNWENVSKRILPQLIYKGQVLQRERLCRKGLFFVCPTPVYERIMGRLGGSEGLLRYGLQPASITFMTYGHNLDSWSGEGHEVPLCLETEHTTTVYKVQEAFNNVALPQENVYRDAITRALALV